MNEYRCYATKEFYSKHNVTFLQWKALTAAQVQSVRNGLLVLVVQPLATSLRPLNEFLRTYNISGINLILDEADTLWTHKAGAGVRGSVSQREECLYSLMGPFANKGGDEIPLFNSRLRTVIAVSKRSEL